MNVYMCSLCFCNDRVLLAGLEALHRTNTPNLVVAHYLLDNHYPFKHYRTQAAMVQAQIKYNARVVDGLEDRGLAGNANFLLKYMMEKGMKEEDLLIGYDPDSKPLNRGWDKTLVEVMVAEPKLAYLSLNNPPIEPNLESIQGKKPYLRGEEKKIAGHRVFIVSADTNDMINVSCWRVSWLKAIGGTPAGPNTPYYGFNEGPLKAAVNHTGMQNGYLLDFKEDGRGDKGWFGYLHDFEYQNWKKDHLSGYRPSFAQWLKDRGISG